MVITSFHNFPQINTDRRLAIRLYWPVHLTRSKEWPDFIMLSAHAQNTVSCRVTAVSSNSMQEHVRLLQS
jgi:hypothetical protein